MEHLVLPKTLICTVSHVPLVCDGMYDGKDFLTYPSRAGGHWTHFTLHNRTRYHVQEANTPSDDRQFESFLQKWLFFGLLYEALHKDTLYKTTDFIEQAEDKSFITTKKLGQYLNEWALGVGTLSTSEKTSRCQHTYQCLRRAWSVLWCLRERPGFNELIKTSLITTYDTLSAAWDKIFADVQGDLPWQPIMNTLGPFTDHDISNMRRNGWCPSVIHREFQELNSPAFRWYIKSMRQYPSDLDHSQCKTDGCISEQITTQTYRPRHVSSTCKCESIGVDEDQIVSILDGNNYAVLEVIGNDLDTVKLKILPYNQSLPYVAISHIWADGLGNPINLKLPKCQILQLQRYINCLAGRTFIWPGEKPIKEIRKLYLWCDSLLCPVRQKPPEHYTSMQRSAFNSRPDVRRSIQLSNKAISHMRKVYMDADYVLVLDKGLSLYRMRTST